MKTSLLKTFAFAATVITLLPASRGLATPVTLVLNSSSVSVSGSGGYRPTDATGAPGDVFISSSYQDSAIAPMMAPFSANLSGVTAVPYLGIFNITLSRSTAEQNTSISGAQITARGGVTTSATIGEGMFGEGLLNQGVHSSATALSTFNIMFQLSEPVSYRIFGVMGALLDDSSQINLALLGQPPSLTIGQLPPVVPGPPPGQWSRTFDLTGELLPGTYEFRAQAGASSGASRGSGNDTGYANFDFTMDFFAVPETGGTLGLLALGVGLLGLRRRLALG